MPKQYRTAQVAAMLGVHPNTVRLYEDCAFITKPQRLENGYRVFTDLHLAQFQMARTALQVEVLQSGLRKQMIAILQLSAQCRFEEAMAATQRYISRVNTERQNAEEALAITKALLCANYSLSAILRMLNALSRDIETDIRTVLDTPKASEDMVTACDQLLTSLDGAEANAEQMLRQLEHLREGCPPHPGQPSR